MTIKKSLVALGTAATVAIAGTGIANAAETPEPPTAGSAEASANRDVFGSITGADALGSYTDGQLDFGKSAAALVAIAGVGASVATIAGAYSAVIKASDTFQGTVDDTVAFLQNQGIL
jgi:hypothetical protein